MPRIVANSSQRKEDKEEEEDEDEEEEEDFSSSARPRDSRGKRRDERVREREREKDGQGFRARSRRKLVWLLPGMINVLSRHLPVSIVSSRLSWICSKSHFLAFLEVLELSFLFFFFSKLRP